MVVLDHLNMILKGVWCSLSMMFEYDVQTLWESILWSSYSYSTVLWGPQQKSWVYQSLSFLFIPEFSFFLFFPPSLLHGSATNKQTNKNQQHQILYCFLAFSSLLLQSASTLSRKCLQNPFLALLTSSDFLCLRLCTCKSFFPWKVCNEFK